MKNNFKKVPSEAEEKAEVLKSLPTIPANKEEALNAVIREVTFTMKASFRKNGTVTVSRATSVGSNAYEMLGLLEMAIKQIKDKLEAPSKSTEKP